MRVTARRNTTIHLGTVFRRITANAFTWAICTCSAMTFAQAASADPLQRTRDDAFYHQLIKLPAADGYQPTRSFTIIVDTERGNQLVAADEPNLRFNMLWMEQFKPGYRSRRGGAAFGMMFRTYVATAYKSYKTNRDAPLDGFPSADSLDHHDGAMSFSDSLDYNLKIDGDEVRLKMEYAY